MLVYPLLFAQELLFIVMLNLLLTTNVCVKKLCSLLHRLALVKKKERTNKDVQ